MLSVNQLSAQIKLTEMWKAKYVEDYPIKFACQTTGVNARETRGNAIGKMIETAKSTKSKASFCGDAPRIWNKAPLVITYTAPHHSYLTKGVSPSTQIRPLHSLSVTVRAILLLNGIRYSSPHCNTKVKSFEIIIQTVLKGHLNTGPGFKWPFK